MSTTNDVPHETRRPWTLEPWLLTPDSTKPPKSPLRYSVIAISRTYGSRGHIVGNLVANALDYDFYDRELLEHIALDAETEVEYLQLHDEKSRDAIGSTVIEWLGGSPGARSKYIRSLLRIFKKICEEGRAVIVGRGADFAIKESFKVRIVAPIEVRIKRVAKLEGVSERKALQSIRRVDSERRNFVRSMFGEDPDDPELYHMVLNTGKLSFDEAASLIVAAVRPASEQEAVR